MTRSQETVGRILFEGILEILRPKDAPFSSQVNAGGFAEKVGVAMIGISNWIIANYVHQPLMAIKSFHRHINGTLPRRPLHLVFEKD